MQHWNTVLHVHQCPYQDFRFLKMSEKYYRTCNLLCYRIPGFIFDWLSLLHSVRVSFSAQTSCIWGQKPPETELQDVSLSFQPVKSFFWLGFRVWGGRGYGLVLMPNRSLRSIYLMLWMLVEYIRANNGKGIRKKLQAAWRISNVFWLGEGFHDRMLLQNFRDRLSCLLYLFGIAYSDCILMKSH